MYQQMSNPENQASTYNRAQSALQSGLQSMVDERQPEVKEMISMLVCEVCELEGLVDSLEKKFESVLRPLAPQPASNELASCKSTQVGEKLHTLSLRLQAARSRIVSILERAEV